MSNASRRLALHEMGHAIVARLSGTDLKEVVLYQEPRPDGSAGHCEILDAKAFRDTDTAAYIRWRMAGRAAEKHVLGTYSETDRDDVELAMQMIAVHLNTSVGSEATKDYFRATEALLSVLMADPRISEWISSGASELQRRRRLSHRDVDELRPGMPRCVHRSR